MATRFHSQHQSSGPLVPIEIPPLAESKEQNEYEPQRVKVLPNNGALLALDSSDKIYSGDNQYNYTVNFTHYQKGVRRATFFGIRGENNIPNVNVKNNTVVYALGGILSTGTIPIGFYTAAAFGPVLETAMNTALPAPAAPFTVTYNAPTKQFVVNNVGTFFFLPNSSFIQRGKRLAGFAEDTVPTTQKISGFACMAYTRYLVIESPQLNAFTKNPYTMSNPLFANIIGFVTLANPDTPSLINEQYNRDLALNQFTATQIAHISITIKDEYGESPFEVAIGSNCEFVILISTIA